MIQHGLSVSLQVGQHKVRITQPQCWPKDGIVMQKLEFNKVHCCHHLLLTTGGSNALLGVKLLLAS